MNDYPARVGSGAPQFLIDMLGYFGTVPPQGAALAGAAYPANNRIMYLPFRLPNPVLATQLYVANTSVSGNIEMGIYSLDGTRIVTTGSVAHAGAGTVQLIDITDTLIGPGTFYLAITLDNTTAQLSRFAPAAVAIAKMLGILSETPGGFGLPASATFAAAQDAYFPACGIAAVATL